MKSFQNVLPVLFVVLPLFFAGIFAMHGLQNRDSEFDTLLVKVEKQKDIEITSRLPVLDTEDKNEQEVLLGDVSNAAKIMAEAVESDKIQEDIKKTKLPVRINHEVPFTSQAPLGDWSLPYQEGCEEATLTMAVHFLLNKGSFTANTANKEILDLVAYEEKNGYTIDLTAKETVKLANEYYGGKVVASSRNDFSIEDIKRKLSEGSLVLLPFAGRSLNNPHFRSPGPLYHMLVIKGYNENGFITNDPGTKFGSNATYSFDVVMSANHDWNNGNVEQGQKAMITITKK